MKLSIITINKNNCKGLESTFASVLAQTFQDFELIVVDGGSTDKSVDIIRNHSSKITNWISENDDGIYDAQNKGILKANGEYCLFLNSGDYLISNDVLKNIFEQNLTEEIVYGDIVYEKEGIENRKRVFPDKLSKYFLLVDVIGHQVQFINRSLFVKYGLYNKEYKVVADYEFFVRMVLKYKVSTRHLPISISVYNLSGFSSSSNQIKQINDERHKIQKIYFSPVLVFFYHSYYLLLQSRLYNIPFVKSSINFIRDIIFKFIKPKNHLPK